MPSKRPTHDDPSAHPAHAVAAEPTTSAIGDYDLPKTTITKIAKSAFEDPSVKVQQDVLLALQKAATVYINYIASAAQETAHAANRKTINNADIMAATTEHLAGIGGDVHAADELRRVLDEELAAFRVNQENIKAAKAAGGSTAGPKRGGGFPGRKKDGEGLLNVMGDEAPSAGVDDRSLVDPEAAAEGGDVPLGGEDDEEIEDGDDDDEEEEAGGKEEDVEAEEMIEELAAGGAAGSDEEMA